MPRLEFDGLISRFARIVEPGEVVAPSADLPLVVQLAQPRFADGRLEGRPRTGLAVRLDNERLETFLSVLNLGDLLGRPKEGGDVPLLLSLPVRSHAYIRRGLKGNRA